tara:strand:+ start:536 stop:964 length:429 start_codon:yes stop_codon:yes gene_type:complete
MAKLKSKVVDMARKYDAKKKRSQINKLTKGKGIKADKNLKGLDKSLRRIRKNPGGFAASILDAASVVAPAGIARKGGKLIGKTDIGKQIIKDLEKYIKRNPKIKVADTVRRKKVTNVPSSKKRVKGQITARARNLARKKRGS